MADLEESVRVDNKLRSFKGRRSSSEFINFKTTDTDELTFVISSNSSGALVVATLESSINQQVFGIPLINIYNDSVSEENMQPTSRSGGDWQGGIDFDVWFDWWSSDNNNQKYKIFITAFLLPHPVRTVIIRVAWRTLFENVITRLERIF